MRQRAAILLAVLATGIPGSSAKAQHRDFEAQASPSQASLTSIAPAESGGGQAISEEMFLGPLLEHDALWIRAHGEDLGNRRAELTLATLFSEPEISATQERVGRGDTETEASISWRPPRPDRRRLAIDRATAEVTAAEASFARSVFELQLDFRRIYAEWAIAARRVELLESDQELLRGLARRSQERGRAGEASGLEVRRIRLAEFEVAARAMVARSELAIARAEAATWRPDLIDPSFPIRPRLPDLPPAPTSEPPTPPGLLALKAELRASELASGLAGKVANLPTITLGWKRVEPESDGAALDGPVVGLAWPIPLPGRARAEGRRAEVLREARGARLDLMQSRFQAQLKGAEASYTELRTAVSAAQAALADADPAVRAAQAAFRLGEGDLAALLEAARAASAARLAALELMSRALEHQRQLERVRGRSFTHPDLNVKLGRPES